MVYMLLVGSLIAWLGSRKLQCPMAPEIVWAACFFAC